MKVILFLCAIVSTGALFGMESNDIVIWNLLTNRTIHAQISHDGGKLSVAIKPQTGQFLAKLAPEHKTSLKLSIPNCAEKSIKLKLEKDQNAITISSDKYGIIIKDKKTGVLATVENDLVPLK